MNNLLNNNSEHFEHWLIIVTGQVQGVGFRPYIFRLAKAENLVGSVANTAAGVQIHIQGKIANLANFYQRLPLELPPLAKIMQIQQEKLALDANYQDFQILLSSGDHKHKVLISPDIGICQDCLNDLQDPKSLRYQYAFINCTNCGPRYSIANSIPWDRNATSMRCFTMCQECAKEYTDPYTRWFHAQPIACPKCGPKLWLVNAQANDQENTQIADNLENYQDNCQGNCQDNCQDNQEQDQNNSHNVLESAVKLIVQGKILAIKGLGGFQLVCNAHDPEVITKLRQRKNRPHKALAVMANNLEILNKYCHLTEQHREILASAVRPIVLCPYKEDANLPLDLISPDSLNLGAMLPTTPLHILLFEYLAKIESKIQLLIMTSGNSHGNPICIGNREALQALSGIADAFLLNNRDILMRVDDSVVGLSSKKPYLMRRARGYVPSPQVLAPQILAPQILANNANLTILGCGAQLKATICLLYENLAVLSQHLGDLDNLENFNFYQQTISNLEKILQQRPQVLVHDLHPDFLSTQYAKERATKAGLKILTLQHHAAHAFALAAEHNLLEPCLALCLDGMGLGSDHKLWGGEVLQIDSKSAKWQRLGHLTNFPLIGGDLAVKEPWRIAFALTYQNQYYQDHKLTEKFLIDLAEDANLAKAMQEILDKAIFSQTSSCGRLFDAMAASLNLYRKISYEGQAAIALEKMAWIFIQNYTNANKIKSLDLASLEQLILNNNLESALIIEQDLETKLWTMSSQAIFANLSNLALAKAGNLDSERVAKIAFYFHLILAKGFSKLVQQCNLEQLNKVLLCGGVMDNALLRILLRLYLEEAGLQVYLAENIPSGDASIALGQAFWASRLLAQ